MPIDIYSTRAQLAALELMPRDYSFLYDTFVSDIGAVEDDRAIYDFRKGVRQMAPVVKENTGGVLMDRAGYETREIGFCTIAPERVIDPENLKGRAFGEDVLGAMTPAQREKKLMARDLSEMRLAIQRRREWMARQVLLTGELSVFRYTNEGRDMKTTMYADYGFTNFFTPGTAWSQAGAKIDDDMKSMYDLVYDGLGEVEVVVMAPDVASAMMANTNYFKLFDAKNVDMGEIITKYRGQGVLAANAFLLKAGLQRDPADPTALCILMARRGDIVIDTTQLIEASCLAFNDQMTGMVRAMQPMHLKGALVADQLGIPRFWAPGQHVLEYDPMLRPDASLHQIFISRWITFQRFTEEYDGAGT